MVIDSEGCSESPVCAGMTCLIGYDVPYAVREGTPACIETNLSLSRAYYVVRLACCACMAMGLNILCNMSSSE